MESIQNAIESVIGKRGRLADPELRRVVVETLLAEVQYWPEWVDDPEAQSVRRGVKMGSLRTVGLESVVRAYVTATAGAGADIEAAVRAVVSMVVHWEKWYFDLAEEQYYSGLVEEQNAYEDAYYSTYGDGDNGTAGVF